MSPVRRRTLAVGGGLAVAAALLADKGSVLGADLPHTALLGAALGAVLALVPDGSVAGRTGAFLGGFLSAWLGYALRAGFLPDAPAGRAVAAVVVVALVTGLAVATDGRAPLWASLVGAAAMLGAYETTFVTTPTGFVADSTTAATTVVLCAALGLLVVTLLDGALGARTADTGSRTTSALGQATVPVPRASVDPDVDAGLDITQEMPR